MEKLDFSIDINAPKEKVWNVLWNDATYPQWTAVFTEGSHAESDWKEGSQILFLDGKGDGLVSKIETLEKTIKWFSNTWEKCPKEFKNLLTKNKWNGKALPKATF